MLGAAAEVPPLPSLPLDPLPAEVRDRVAAAMRRAQEQPASAAATGELGMLLHAYEQVSAAASAYERARVLDPAAFDWTYLAGVLSFRTGRPAEAVPALREAVARQPRLLAARLRLGEALVAAGNMEEAHRLYRALVAQHPDVPQAHYGLGRTRAARGEAVAAAESYGAAIRLFPSYGAAHYVLGLLYRDLGRRDEAQEHLRLYQRHWLEAPTLPDPVLERVAAFRQDVAEALVEGVRLGESGDLAGAIRAHERVLERDPKSMRARSNLIAFFARAGRWEKVEEHYRAAVAAAPVAADVHYNYGLALAQQGRRAEAAEAFHRVLIPSPLHAPAHNQLGRLLEAEGKLEVAADRYRQAAANQAGFRLARFNLGRVLVALGRPREAVEQFEQILEPDDEEVPRYLHALAVAWARAGELDRARARFQDARGKAAARGQTQLLALIESDLSRLEASTPR